MIKKEKKKSGNAKAYVGRFFYIAEHLVVSV